jgi:hypothetical protein
MFRFRCTTFITDSILNTNKGRIVPKLNLVWHSKSVEWKDNVHLQAARSFAHALLNICQGGGGKASGFAKE